jgi:hypothetical protein
MYASAKPKSPNVNNLSQNLSDVTLIVALAPGLRRKRDDNNEREVSDVDVDERESEWDSRVDGAVEVEVSVLCAIGRGKGDEDIGGELEVEDMLDDFGKI